MTQAILERAQQLVQTRRFDLAEKELKGILSQNPNEPDALTLLAICKSEQGDHKEALAIIQRAISIEPDSDYILYLQGIFYLKNDNLKEAEKSIRNAITFQPDHPDYFGALAAIKLNQKEWQQALDFANAGLEKDPDNLQCLNSRSTALYKLNRKSDAYHTIQEALHQDPENDSTHANLGWALLEQRDHQKALTHFREALKINPDNELAKAGMVQALKARYFFYRIFLRYAFWISNMQAKGQWIFIIGMYIGVKVLQGLADSNSALSAILTPIIYLYMAFAISTWIIGPLSNLFLRLNVYGRYALTEEERKSSNFVGVAFLIGVIGTIAYLFTGDFLYLMVLFFGLTMMIPLSSIYNPVKKSSQRMLTAYAIALAVVGIFEIVVYAGTETSTIFSTIYIFGMLAYQFVANALTIR